MSFNANAYYVMLASPSDVKEELEIARKLILEWNNVNAFSRKIVLLPINWKYNSFSSFGNRPQDILNQQILKNADLLVGIFWTRIGTPTGKAISGTVEEIDEHIKSGKPTMLYFSERNVKPDMLDTEQYAAVLSMKKEYQKIGLTHSFNSDEDFRNQFQIQLALLLNSSEYFKAPEIISFEPLMETQREEKRELSKEAKILLIEGSEDPNGQILNLRFMSGFEIQTNGKNLNEDDSPRTEAKWDAAIEELTSLELIRSVGYKGEIYALTIKGYELADLLKSEK